MHSKPYDKALASVSAQIGIEPEYWDIWKKRHATTPAMQRAILRAFGVEADTLEGLERALDAHRRRTWHSVLPPALVTGPDAASPPCPLRVPQSAAMARAEVSIRLEDGGTREFETGLAGVPETARETIDGVDYVEKTLALPPDLPLGYHNLRVRIAGLPDASMPLIVAPDRAYQPDFVREGRKAAGLAIALYGVRSERNWGCGDLRDLRDVVDWAGQALNVSFIALNPLHAVHNRRPFNTSPYLPNCTYYQNFIYLDVEAVEEFAHSRRAQAAFHNPQTRQTLAELRAAAHVEYEGVAALKTRLLKLAFATFLRAYRKGTPRALEFRAFVEREGDLLERYATYCALDEFIHRRQPDVWVWQQWPAAYQDPDSVGTQEFRRRHWRSVMFYQYLQWLLDGQLADIAAHARERLGVGLYHDLALATDSFGSDLWAHRPFFVHGCRVGAPPDDFSPKGQDWGFPPPNSGHHREDGYRLFRESIRKNCRHGGALRLDHVMRFFRLYWIPDGLDASQGAYVRDSYMDLLRILALESVRHRVLVVGEDLGTVQASVQETLAKFGINSYRLLYFEKDKRGNFLPGSAYPAQALVSSTTHDLPTLAGFWLNEDIRARRDAGVIDERDFAGRVEERNQEKQKLLNLLLKHHLLPRGYPRHAADLPEWTAELQQAVVEFLASAPSQLMALNQEDMTREVYQQNLPGTTWQYPNWGRKMLYTVEELRGGGEAGRLAALVRGCLERGGTDGGVAWQTGGGAVIPG